MSDALTYLRDTVRRLKPGQEIRVTWGLLKQVPQGYFNEVAPADQVLRGIVGSAYEFTHREDPENQTTVFGRLKEPLPTHQRTFVDPDRAHFFEKRGDVYQLIG